MTFQIVRDRHVWVLLGSVIILMHIQRLELEERALRGLRRLHAPFHVDRVELAIAFFDSSLWTQHAQSTAAQVVAGIGVRQLDLIITR